MLKPSVLVVVLSLVPVIASAQQADPGKGSRMQLGAGVHYMKTVGDVKNSPDFNSDALNILVAGRKGLGLIGLEIDSEWALDYGGSGKTLWMPQALATVGGLIYGGAGIGTGYIDGNWFDRPTYTLRAGVNLPLGGLTADLNANYQFMNAQALENLSSKDLNAVTFGATLWF